jgi:FixJ family two-component response regulator
MEQRTSPILASSRQKAICCQEAKMFENGHHNSNSHRHAHPNGQLGKVLEPQEACSLQGQRVHPGDFARPAINESGFTVFIVDDDAAVLMAMSNLLRCAGHRIATFSSAIDFLDLHDDSVPGCVILDVFMPDLDGLRLQANLTARGVQRPIIFMTGRGDVPTSVQAMKAGAVDFLTKPVREDDLFAAIAQAERKEIELRQSRNELASINAKLATLTQRQHEVLTRVIAGRLNKQIAFDLKIGEKTIKVHRGRMMHKLGVRTVAELVRLTNHAGIGLQH